MTRGPSQPRRVMPHYLVYETEYPEEGSFLIEATDKEAAAAEWMRITGTTEAEDPVLSVDEADVAALLARRRVAIDALARIVAATPDSCVDCLREAIAEFADVDGALLKMGA